jgi:hypothetical protein
MSEVGGFVEDATGINMGSNSAADRGVAAQQEASQQATALQREMFNTIRKDQQPYRAAGSTAVGTLAGGNVLKNFQGDPGFQFRLQEGMKAVQGSAAAKGSLNSGATLKALSRYGQDFASNEYNNAYGREYQRLSGLAGLGQNAAAQTGNAGMNYAQQAGNNMMGSANAQAAAAMGQAQQRSQTAQQGMNFAQTMFSDERLKINITPVSAEDLKELKSSIKPYHFNYISEEFGEGDWVGVMAQDLEKSKLGRTVVFEDELGQKRVHFPKLLSLLVTTFSEEAA